MTFKRTVTMVALVWFFAIIVLVLAMVGLILDIKPIMCITCYFNAFYIASSTVNQWRSQPDNLVPLCKFKVIIIIHFFRN